MGQLSLANPPHPGGVRLQEALGIRSQLAEGRGRWLARSVPLQGTTGRSALHGDWWVCGLGQSFPSSQSVWRMAAQGALGSLPTRIQGPSQLSLHMQAIPLYPSVLLTSTPGERRGSSPRGGPQGWLQAGQGCLASPSPLQHRPPFPLDPGQSVSASSASVSRTLRTGQFLTVNPAPTTRQAEKFQAKAISQPGRKLPPGQRWKAVWAQR